MHKFMAYENDLITNYYNYYISFIIISICKKMIKKNN